MNPITSFLKKPVDGHSVSGVKTFSELVDITEKVLNDRRMLRHGDIPSFINSMSKIFTSFQNITRVPSDSK